ncbi:hypothetical protein JD844_027875 [Phrynosoma platyrhinos]|uniref:Uncharacterized protein n=1 Tax=Phrynosoma platyrhinos TaxID=52577 RepID=A0ABQ7SGX8_PHRPL|nr:hypothetical protein JD844_027875 [Phrynosoma platyrhinos]
MIADVLMGRTAQETVSMKARSNTMARFGFWRMIDALSVPASRVKLIVGPCLAQKLSVNSVYSQRMSVALIVSQTPVKQTPLGMISPRRVWMKLMWFDSLDHLGLSMAQNAPSVNARMAMFAVRWIHSAFRNCEANNDILQAASDNRIVLCKRLVDQKLYRAKTGARSVLST